MSCASTLPRVGRSSAAVASSNPQVVRNARYSGGDGLFLTDSAAVGELVPPAAPQAMMRVDEHTGVEQVLVGIPAVALDAVDRPNIPDAGADVDAPVMRGCSFSCTCS